MDQDIMVVSSNQIEGRQILEYLGVVAGSIVKSRNAGSDNHSRAMPHRSRASNECQFLEIVIFVWAG